MSSESKEIEEIITKYKNRLNKEFGEEDVMKKDDVNKVTTREYEQFKRDILPSKISLYEKLCHQSETLLKLKPDKKKEAELYEAITTAHLAVTPTGTTSLAILLPLVYILVGVLLSIIIPTILSGEISKFFIVFTLFTGLGIMIPLQKFPFYLANNWRMKASNQMVLCVFYIVTYMRHTSNIELAIEFASNHLTGPLALDLKKVLWDIETEKYSTLKESLDNYLETWRKYNIEFIEAMHLIESSLYETSDSRRLDLLDKSLEVILEETYEKMLHYAQNLKSPITTLHMLGIILPILGLVLLPLVVSFMKDATGNPMVEWYHLVAIYNVVLPISVYFLGKNILATRPTGYGDTDISSQLSALDKYKKLTIKIGNSEIGLSAFYISLILGIIFLMIAISPIVLHLIGMDNIGFLGENVDTSCKQILCFVSYDEDINTDVITGPNDLLSAALSLFFPLSLAVGVGLYYKLKSKNILKIREDTKNLEAEFAQALFQLGNRLGDGLPAEIAFLKTARVMSDTASGRFFKQVTNNIQNLGMNLSPAIFDPKVGAIISFPSKIIESSMKVLIQAIQKGPRIAATALINISKYIKEMHRVSERLNDLLSDIISSMKSQISLLTPIIAGIVVGITSMITNILGSLGTTMAEQGGGAVEGMEAMPMDFFGRGIPTYHFQIVVGLYVIQIVYILTILCNSIENGSDKLNEQFLLGKNLLRSGILYCMISLIIMLIFNIIASMVMEGINV